MRELSLNILDIAKNSVTANAKVIEIAVSADTRSGFIAISVTDDGHGMDGELLNRVTDPFFTSRTTRKVGMGLPLLRQAALETGGSFDIKSQPGEGTFVQARFRLNSLNRMPMGSLTDTVLTLLLSAENYDIVLKYSVDGRSFEMDSREIKKQVDFEDFTAPEILEFLKGYVQENIDATNGGVSL